MKVFCLLILFLLTSSDFLVGDYEYREPHFKESIKFFENKKFIYQCTRQMAGTDTIEGYYQIVNDSLILSSSPQRDKIIVHEHNKGKFKNKMFNVTDKNSDLITFHLYVTLQDNSQLEFRDCFEKIKFNSIPIKSFYMIDTRGLKTSNYLLKGSHTNFFEIQFETNRVFDNEAWGLKDGKIQPKGLDGEIGNYYLSKK